MVADSQAKKGNFLRPEMQEVVEAARSLYADELRPFGRILLKRIRERVAAAQGEADVDAVPLIDPRHLRKICESCPLFRVEPAEGREYAVAIVGASGVFVDPCSPLDPYPASLWKEASDYFGIGEGRAERLPSGRYACAQLLMSRGAGFLQGRSLGEACHIVQLAISQKKILGYAHGQLVPYSQSEECAKEACALRQQPSGPSAEADMPFASWEDLRIGMVEVLRHSTNPAPGVVTLSNVKRLFRAHLNLELCETVLGHSRVWELLQDARLQDVCAVHGLGNGQAVVTLVPSLFTMHYLAGVGHIPPGNFTSQVMPPVPPSVPMMQTGPAAPSSTCASNRMPLAFGPPAPAPLPPLGSGARGPLSTVPVATIPKPSMAVTTLPPHMLGQPQPPSTAQSSNFGSEGGSADLAARMLPLRWDSFGDERPFSLPTTMEEGDRKGPGSDTDCTPSVAADDAESSSTGSASGLQFLTIEDPATLPPLRWESETEEDDDACGYRVKNTFVDVSPRSPQRHRRSRSVPKDANLSPTRSSRCDAAALSGSPFRL